MKRSQEREKQRRDGNGTKRYGTGKRSYKKSAEKRNGKKRRNVGGHCSKQDRRIRWNKIKISKKYK